MSQKLVYVAAPFWHDDENVRNYRRRKAIEYSETLFNKGIPFYSPLMYSERFKERKAKEGYWIEHGLKMVDVCDEMRVLCLEGWELSGGIKGEVARAEARGIEVKYIEKHARLSFHGSRDLTLAQCTPAIMSIFEKYQPESIVTHGEPEGACEHVRNLARKEGLPLTLHHLQHWRLAGQFHWRSTAVLEDSERAIFLHDGSSQGTSNELALARKMGVPFDYFKMVEGVLTLTQEESEDTKDYTLDLLEDSYEKGLSNAVRQSPEYQRFRKAVLKRDKEKCVFCSKTELLCVHHIVPFAKNSALAMDASNGQTLCEECHRGVHGKVQRTRSK